MEKLLEYARRYRDGVGADDVGHFARWLDEQGFIIVPKPYKAPARRGNSKKPPIYTGPDLIGKSHAARIVGS